MVLRVRIGMEWGIGGSQIDLAAISQLLEEIATAGTIRAAADKLGVSYRHVWGQIKDAEILLDQKLLVKSKGQGSVLTQAGDELKSMVDKFTHNLQNNSQNELILFEKNFRNYFISEQRELKLACSHDLILENCMQAGLLSGWDIRFMGSQKALNALRAGTVDLAGFHFSEKMAGQLGMKELWADPNYFVAPILCRELGLVVAQGNPLGIRCVEDLVRPGVRFINRQEKSGTRLRLEELLRTKRVDPKIILGYQKIEFTHMGVVHTVATGGADVAFALRASTTGLNVDFIPIGYETYCVCGKISIVETECYQNLLQTVNDNLKAQTGYSKPPAVFESATLVKGNPIAAISWWEDAIPLMQRYRIDSKESGISFGRNPISVIA